MRGILSQRPLRFVFAANLVSMLGSGMNASAVAWYILQRTHSETALGALVILQTIPAMFMLPFTGVIIDREDRRRLVMWLDAVRGLVILAVAILAFRHRVQVWQLYLMNMLVSAGFWMFWPTITALIQELTPEGEFVGSNTILMAGVQSGWLIAGAIVGFMYNHIGLGGVLLIDVSTYVVSFLCYFAVRKGRHVVIHPQELRADIRAAESQLLLFWHDLREGLHFLRDHPAAVTLGIAWALFLGAMMNGGIVTPSLSDRIFHAGPVGYGWLSAGWGTGAFLSVFYTPHTIAWLGGRRAVAFSMALLAVGMACAPVSRFVSGDRDLFRDGLGPRRGRRRHEYQFDGNGPQTLNGPRAEHLLFPRHIPANRTRPGGRNRRPQRKPGRRIRHTRRCLRNVVRCRQLAGGRGRRGRSRREVMPKRPVMAQFGL